jgi:hypothetical protein
MLDVTVVRDQPKTPLDIRQLIREMSVANPLWGAPRIHGELLKYRSQPVQRSKIHEGFNERPTHARHRHRGY